MLPARLEPIAYGLVLSALMSLIVSGISTFRALGPVDGFFGLWMSAWLPSWMIAFPILLAVAPIARRIVHSLVRA